MANIKTVTIQFPDTTDISGFVPGSVASIAAGPMATVTTLEGIVMMVAQVAEPPSQLVTHAHGAVIGPPIP